MRQMVLLLVIFLLPSMAQGQLLMYEGFNYTADAQLSGNVNPVNNNTWNMATAPAPTPATAKVLNGNLSYVGLPAPTGNTFALPRVTNGNTSRINLTTAPYPGTAAAD